MAHADPNYEGEFISDFFRAAPVLAMLVMLILIAAGIGMWYYRKVAPEKIDRAANRQRLGLLLGLISLFVAIVGAMWWLTRTDFFSQVMSRTEHIRHFDPADP